MESAILAQRPLQSLISLKRFKTADQGSSLIQLKPTTVHLPLTSRSRYRQCVITRAKQKSKAFEPATLLQSIKINEGLLLLLAVSFLWGSYTPTLRAVFTTPGAPSPIFVAAARGILQVGLFTAVTAFGLSSSNTDNSSKEAANSEEANDAVIKGSLEIGAYNTLGTLMQTWGLSVRFMFNIILFLESKRKLPPTQKHDADDDRNSRGLPYTSHSYLYSYTSSSIRHVTLTTSMD